MLYLDNAATTKIHSEVLREMSLSMFAFGNADSRFYAPAEEAKKLIRIARDRVAGAVNAGPDQVIFTSGATEANNFVLKGVFRSGTPRKNKIVISAVEHASVYETCKYLESIGARLAVVPVDRTGTLDLAALDESIDDSTALVSVIYVNNEIGTVQDLRAINDVCRSHNVRLHIDATQAVGKTELDINKYSALNYVTFTAHKMFGPKGIGCLIEKSGEYGRLVPLIHGGHGENGYRAGTLSTELIVGFGKACEIANNGLEVNRTKLIKYEKIILDKLRNKFGDKLILNNAFENRIPGLLNVRLRGYNNAVFLKAVSSDIAASSGSACAVTEPSRILLNIGMDPTAVSESVRLSLSPYQKESDFDILDKL